MLSKAYGAKGLCLKKVKAPEFCALKGARSQSSVLPNSQGARVLCFLEGNEPEFSYSKGQGARVLCFQKGKEPEFCAFKGARS